MRHNRANGLNAEREREMMQSVDKALGAVNRRCNLGWVLMALVTYTLVFRSDWSFVRVRNDHIIYTLPMYEQFLSTK